MSAFDPDGDYTPASLFGDDDSDEDPHYEPPGQDRAPRIRHRIDDSASSNEDDEEIEQSARGNEPTAVEDESSDGEDEPRPKRAKHPGRKKTRRVGLWKRTISKEKRNNGKAYFDRKGKHHTEKKVREYNHVCRFKCNEKLDENKRKEIFTEYWELGNWELQSAFLSSSIKVDKPERKKKEGKGSKSLSCQFYLLDNRVCKKFFLNTLDISNKRITNIISKKDISATGISPKDKRGHKVPANKVCEEKVEFAKEHIRSFPKYSSHYSRTQAPNKKYLSGYLNITKLYSLYKEHCNEQGLEPIKDSYYRHLFNTCFNLSFHKPHTDTCGVCDKLQNNIENGLPHEKEAARIKKEVHLRKADAARKQIIDAKKEADEDASHVAICFDLQKMLPSPVLTCSKVYYSRQLWTYNFCIHNLVTGNAGMFMWHEGQAARGCEEMLSCLWRFISTLPTRIKKLTMFSDNAGGQNKSRFTVKFWLYVVKTTHIEQVDQKYLLSGHSYNDCDKNFGVIERARKNYGEKRIFVPQDWMSVVAKSSNRFLVSNMEVKDFISLEPLEEYYVKSVKGIRQMQWMRFKKSDPDTLFYKTTFNHDMPFSEYNMKPKQKKVGSRSRPHLVQQLPSKQGAPGIKGSKFKDLQELLEFVPPEHHLFYRTLKVQPTRNQPRRGEPMTNYGDGSNDEEEEDMVLDSDSD